MIPAISTAKLIGYGIGALAVIALFAMVMGWRSTMIERGKQLGAICQATRSAAANPKLDCHLVPNQITAMGQSIGTLTQALNKQNAAVEAMGAETARQQREAAQALQNAAGRAKRASVASDSLKASASAGERLKQPCEPSKALREAWR